MSAGFVAAADEVYRLQNGRDDESQFLQRMANQGHYRNAGGTRQGIYVCTPGGRLLASVNSNQPDVVMQTLKRGLTEWQSLSEVDRMAGATSVRPSGRWERLIPDDGLVLRSTIRDLEALEDGRFKPRRRWNRDYVWYSRSEMTAWLPEELRDTDGVAVADPRLRLARFHFVDNARGQALPFHADDVVLDFEPSNVAYRKGRLVRFRINGATKAYSDGTWRMGDSVWKPSAGLPYGMVTRVSGWAEYDLTSKRFTRFELSVLGRFSGRTLFNGRRRDEPEGYVGWTFELVGDPRAALIAPTFIELYDAAWIKAGVK